LWQFKQHLSALVGVPAACGLFRVVVESSASSNAEWQSEAYDALGGTLYPPSSQLLLWKEKAGFGGHIDDLARHLGEMDEPRLPGLVRGDDGGIRSRVA